MRAFLSHASSDKTVVSEVAKELGRQYCLLDKWNFSSGEDFRSAIRKGLDTSDVFVLFASQESLQRDWVNFEIDEAELRRIRGSIKRFLVFIIDDSARLENIPEWLRRGRILTLSAPRAIAREIIYHIHELIRDQQHPHFVGRSEEIAELERTLSPVDGSPPPRSFVMYGLPGVGRRTLCRRAASDLLSFRKLVIIPVESGDSINDIALKVSEEIAPLPSTEELRRSIEHLEQEPLNTVLSGIVANMSSMMGNGDMPVLLDQGGMLDNDGNLTTDVSAIVSAITASPEIYLVLITARRPRLDVDLHLSSIPMLRIPEMKTEDIKRLLARNAIDRGIELNATELSDLAEYSRGYPPAVFYALELVKIYTIDFVLQDKHRLVTFRTSYFMSILKKDNQLNEVRQSILRMLSHYGALPLTVIGGALGLSIEELTDNIGYLFDCVFVIPDEDGRCRLAEPLVDSIHRVVGGIENINHKELAEALNDYVGSVEGEDKRLDMARALFRSQVLGGVGSTDASVRLASDLIRLTEDFYHQQDYENAVKYGEVAISQRPRNVDVRIYYVRALVKFEQYQEAETQISELRDLGELREAYFLTGFMERRRENLVAAIDAFEEAVKRGRRGVAVHRELADCYFRIKNLQKARQHIDLAQRRDSENRYVVDLQIQIATDQGDEETARSRLEVLRIVDHEPFYLHRLSTVEHAFGKIEQAYAAAKSAFASHSRPTLAMVSQLIKCEIETERGDDAAEHISYLERRFPRVKHDIRIGLKCKWEISQRQYRNADTLWGQLRDKSKSVHKALRRDVLRGLLQELSNGDRTKEKYAQEFAQLEEELQSLNPMDLEFVVVDD